MLINPWINDDNSCNMLFNIWLFHTMQPIANFDSILKYLDNVCITYIKLYNDTTGKIKEFRHSLLTMRASYE